MQKYILQRFLLTVPTVVAVTILTFLFLRVFLPSDVIDLIIGEYGRNDPALRKTLEKELGLSGNLATQYSDWVGLSWFTGGDKGILAGQPRQVAAQRPLRRSQSSSTACPSASSSASGAR